MLTSALLRRTRQPMVGLATRTLSTLESTAAANTTTSASTPSPAPQSTTAAPSAASAAAASVPSSRSSARPSPPPFSPPPPRVLLPFTPTRPFLFFGAPLEDVSESAFRLLLSDCGADLLFSEMSRVDNLARKSASRSGTSWLKTTHSLSATPCSIQLLASNEDSLRVFLEHFQADPRSFAGFNLNLGCPSPAILALGLGAQAIKRIAKTQRYVEKLNEWIEKNCTGEQWVHRPSVSVKLRLGANEREKKMGSHILLIKALNGRTPEKSIKAQAAASFVGVQQNQTENTAATAAAAAVSPSSSSSSSSSGPVSHIILHGRHGKEHYETPCDFSAIARAIEETGATNIIANGDIHTIEQVKNCIDMGARGVMIGRAAVKEPAIFTRLKMELAKERKDVFTLPSPLLNSSSTITLPTPISLRDTYLSHATRFFTPVKYQSNVSGRIGQLFEPNPVVQLSDRMRVEMQGRKHPNYETVRREDARREMQQAKMSPHQKQKVNFRQSMEEQLQDSVQG